MNIESVKKLIASLEAAGELTIKERIYLYSMKEHVALEAQVKQLVAERDAVVAESAGIQKRMQQLIDIINKADNDWCMCGEAMESHGHGGCGHPIGMFDYHYGRWSESETKTPATDAAIASLRAEGVELFAEYISLYNSNAESHAHSFAAQLRRQSAPSPASPASPAPLSAAITDIIAERQRQKDAKGYTETRDDNYLPGVLNLAGAAYAVSVSFLPDAKRRAQRLWPWTDAGKYLRASPKDPRSALVKAGALIAAEIERIARAASQSGEVKS